MNCWPHLALMEIVYKTKYFTFVLFAVPALPPPPHGRATAPPPGERKRMFNYSMPPTQMQQTGLTSMNGTQPLTPVVTRDPMVVMDRAEKNR